MYDNNCTRSLEYYPFYQTICYIHYNKNQLLNVQSLSVMVTVKVSSPGITATSWSKVVRLTLKDLVPSGILLSKMGMNKHCVSPAIDPAGNTQRVDCCS